MLYYSSLVGFYNSKIDAKAEYGWHPYSYKHAFIFLTVKPERNGEQKANKGQNNWIVFFKKFHRDIS